MCRLECVLRDSLIRNGKNFQPYFGSNRVMNFSLISLICVEQINLSAIQWQNANWMKHCLLFVCGVCVCMQALVRASARLWLHSYTLNTFILWISFIRYKRVSESARRPKCTIWLQCYWEHLQITFVHLQNHIDQFAFFECASVCIISPYASKAPHIHSLEFSGQQEFVQRSIEYKCEPNRNKKKSEAKKRPA